MKDLSIGVAALSVFLLPSWMPVQGGGFGQGGDPPNNILLIVLDDVGVETLNCFYPCVPGAPLPTAPTPRLSALAASGVKFTRVYANPLCSPSRATIMTGRYGFRTGMGYLSTALDEGLADYSLPLSEKTIPEMLTDGPVLPLHPYTCGAFGKWHLCASGELSHPIDQGFDLFVGSIENTGGHFNWDKIHADSSCAYSTHVGQAYSTCSGTFDETTFSASVIRQEASAWIATAPESFFAYVCFNPPHAPWQVPPYSLLSAATLASFNHADYPEGEPQSGGADARKAYNWMLEAIDTEVGHLIDSIPASKVAHTTIIVVADNGTPGPVIDPFFDPAHAKGFCYEQGVNVPMIASGYKVNAGGLTCTRLVNTVDIWRTCIQLAGLPAPTGFTFDGKSFKNLLSNPSGPAIRTTAFSQLYTANGPYDPANPAYADVCNNPNVPPALMSVLLYNQRQLTDGRYKYIRSYKPPYYQRAYDLLNDPTELTDLWAQWNAMVPTGGWPQDADACDITPNPAIPGQTEVWALRNAMVTLSAP